MIRCKKPWTYEEDKDALKIITTNTNLNTVKWAEVSLLHVFHCGDKFRKKYYKTENKWDKHSMTNMLKVVWNARWSIPPPDKTAWYQRYWSQDFLDHRMTEPLAPVIGIATFCRWIWEDKSLPQTVTVVLSFMCCPCLGPHNRSPQPSASVPRRFCTVRHRPAFTLRDLSI